MNKAFILWPFFPPEWHTVIDSPTAVIMTTDQGEAKNAKISSSAFPSASLNHVNAHPLHVCSDRRSRGGERYDSMVSVAVCAVLFRQQEAIGNPHPSIVQPQRPRTLTQVFFFFPRGPWLPGNGRLLACLSASGVRRPEIRRASTHCRSFPASLKIYNN